MNVGGVRSSLWKYRCHAEAMPLPEAFLRPLRSYAGILADRIRREQENRHVLRDSFLRRKAP